MATYGDDTILYVNLLRGTPIESVHQTRQFRAIFFFQVIRLSKQLNSMGIWF